MEVGVAVFTLTPVASSSARVLTNHRSTPHERPRGCMGVGGVGRDEEPPPQAASPASRMSAAGPVRAKLNRKASRHCQLTYFFLSDPGGAGGAAPE